MDFLFLLPLLGGALGAALINVGLAIYKLKKDKNEEHRQWTRNEKLKTYTQFLSDLNPLSKKTMLMLASKDKEAQHEYDQVRTKAFLSMLLVANDEVMGHTVELVELTKSLSSLSEAAYKEALDEVEKRKEQGRSLDGFVEEASDKAVQAALEHAQEMHNVNFKLMAAMRKDLGLDSGLKLNATVTLP